MDKTQSFKEFLATRSPEVPLLDFALNLVLAAVVAAVLAELYARYGRSLSNRRVFARNFLPIAATTMLVITIVKSSLALSLGLVGALSIVRFRAAIKEPEELAFLFLAIGAGLGFGADQRAVTLIAVAFIALCLVLRDRVFSRSGEEPNLFLTVSGGSGVEFQAVVDAVVKNASEAELVRLDEKSDGFEISFDASFADLDRLKAAKEALRGLDPELRLSFVKSDGSAA
jgi:hypothetical protein